MIKSSLLIGVISLGLFACDEKVEETPPELSGVAYRPGEIIVVSDERNHCYYSFDWDSMIPILPNVWKFPRKAKVRELEESPGKKAKDCESVTIFDDDVYVLSENHRRVFGPRGVFWSWEKIESLKETRKGAGLEGFDIRRDPDELTVAALWEGGKGSARLPRLVISKVGGDRLDDFIRGRSERDHSVPLDWSMVEDYQGVTPGVIRGTDLVAYPNEEEVQWLVILSETRGNRRKWLQRFDSEGGAVGRAMLLRAPAHEGSLPENFERFNWEGLGWYDRDRGELLLVHDTEDKDSFLWKVKFEEETD